MSQLLTTLARAGLITADTASDLSRRVLESAATRRIREVDAVLEAGVCDEAKLVGFLQSRMMIPQVTAEVLSRLDHETVNQIPADLAWDHGMLAVSIDDANNLTLAMADPTDVRAVAAAAAHTGAYVIRAVAPPSALREAIYRHLGPRPMARPAIQTPREMPAYVESDDAPVGEPPPLSPVAYAHMLPRLTRSADRDDVITAVLDFLGGGFVHVIVFVHLQQQLRGRDARGPELLTDAVSQVRIPTTPPSVFSDAIRSRTSWLAPWPTERSIDVAFSRAMGGIEGDALVMPIPVGTKVPVVFFAAGPIAELEPGTLAAVTQATAAALERLIYRKRSVETRRID